MKTWWQDVSHWIDVWRDEVFWHTHRWGQLKSVLLRTQKEKIECSILEFHPKLTSESIMQEFLKQQHICCVFYCAV